MNKDNIFEEKSFDYEEYKKNQINWWIKNGANQLDASQLFEDMITDQYHSDPDMDIHYDITIDEKIELYGGYYSIN